MSGRRPDDHPAHDHDYTMRDLMIIAGSRLVQDGNTVLVGIGLPMLAAALAKQTHAPNLVMIFETGIVDGCMNRIPLAVGDPSLVTGAGSIFDCYSTFAYLLGAGYIDIGFLGAAQIDRFGNINTTVIGDWQQPRVRLPGSGGASDIACLARKTVVIMPHKPRHFAERVDFLTTPGNLTGGDARRRAGLGGGGPEAVITDLGIFGFDPDSGEMMLTSVHPGVSADRIKHDIPWPLRVASNLAETPPPTATELLVLREEVESKIVAGKET